MNQIQIYQGNIVHTPTKEDFEIVENGYIIVNGKYVEKVVKQLPTEYKNYPINTFGNKLIIPGMVDTHIHASQFPNQGLRLDEPLLTWLNDCTFPTEAKFSDLEFAQKVYQYFIHELWRSGTTRALVYNTIHYPATRLLFDMIVQSGIGAYIGKVNMDINCPDDIKEDTEESLYLTEKYIKETNYLCDLVKPIITPRFVPSCSEKLLEGLGKLAKKYHVPVMSHLSEALDEIKIVKEMYPNELSYGHVYNKFGLFGQEKTIMAHCIYSNEEEMKLMKENGVWAAHNPSSNFNLGSGLMPVRNFLNMGIQVGLGCDVASGSDESMFVVMKDAIEASKLVRLYSNNKLNAIKASEAFFLSTKGGGSFFGKVGSFEPGYEFDAIVIDDSRTALLDYTVRERIERFIYIGNKNDIHERYIAGRHIPEPSLNGFDLNKYNND